MTHEERDLLRATLDLSDGQATLIPFDEIAIRLNLRVTATRTLSALLGSRQLPTVTFGGIQLTRAGSEPATLRHAE